MSRRRLAVIALFALVFALSGWLSFAAHRNKPQPQPDLKSEIADVHGRWHRKWDAERDEHSQGKGREQAREEWRKGHHAELRSVYRKHGRACPEHLLD